MKTVVTNSEQFAAPSFMPDWINVEDHLPSCNNDTVFGLISDTMHIFGVDTDGNEAFGFGDYCAGKNSWRNYGGNFDFMHVAKVTHYMPISRPRNSYV